MLDFPANPTIGQVFTSGGVTWIWDGTKWVASGVAGQPPLATGDNRIINGDMSIDQRNGGAAGTANGYTADRWFYNATQASKGSWSRSTGGASLLAVGFGYSLQFGSSSAYAALAGDTFFFTQPIEADMLADLAFGTPSAQPITLSFWANSSLTGTFSGSFRNGANTRSYPFTFSIPVASTWTRIIITIPGDPAGAWVLQGNSRGASLSFDLGSGSTSRGPANAWASANYTGATGTVSVVGTNGAQFYVTGVKLEIGSVATPYNRQSLAKSMVDCQRYYQTGNWLVNGYASIASLTMQSMMSLLVTMRAMPTGVVVGTPTYSNCSGAALGIWDGAHINASILGTAIGWVSGYGAFTASAEL